MDTEPVLTPRQLQVLLLITADLPQKAISAKLGVSPKTVNTHIIGIKKKFKVKGIAGITKAAIKQKLVSL